MLNLSHLADTAQAHVTAALPDRIRHVHTARWISYPRAEEVLASLQRLFDYPQCARMPCMLLYGDSGVGKTMILEKFSRMHRGGYDATQGRATRPLIVIDMPPAPDERRLYGAILEALRAPYLQAAPLWSLELSARALMRRVGVQALVIDEVHHLLAGSYREQRRSLNVLKSLANRLKITVIAVGTRDALEAIQSDPQIVSRFEPMELPRWSESDTFRAFLLALQRELPLQKASSLADRECTQLLLRRSEGITGRVCWIVGQAAEEALRSGVECITPELLDTVSERVRRSIR